MTLTHQQCIAFAGTTKIAEGDLSHVAKAARAAMDNDSPATLIIFNAETSHRIEVNLDGNLDVLSNPATTQNDTPAPPPKNGPGRPKLGVVAREITLLPRHWEWLSTQPGGASVSLRKLVEEARRKNAGADAMRQAQEACYKFISIMAGDEPGFEEAARALYQGNLDRFKSQSRHWPDDVKAHAHALAERSILAAKA